MNKFGYLLVASLGLQSWSTSPALARDSNTTSIPYLDYYCNAKRVTASSWTPPPHSPSAELVHITLFMRHHARTPDNLLPNESNFNSVDWDCSDLITYNFASSPNVESRVPLVYHQTSSPAWHPWLQTFWGGTCQQGQLTAKGWEDSVQHGKDLWSVYHPRLIKSIDDLYVRTSTEERTFHVATGMLLGMDPKTAGKRIGVNVQPKQFDSLVPSYSCPRADQLRREIQATPAWNAHLQANIALKYRLDEVLGTANRFTTWYDPYFDIFASRLCNGHGLPCNKQTGACISDEDAAAVFDIGDFEYNYIWNAAEQSANYTRLSYGVMFQELVLNFKGVVAGSAHKARLYIGHDGSIIRLASGLGIGKPESDGALRWPALGSEIIFEWWRKDKELFVRVIYGGLPVKSLEWLRATDLIALLEANVPANLYEVCNP
ncbi:phosphoglycerate mutase-like protein [Auriculariales sp. MPI-PUGE-AT-0066]|nr:phosphoglycerate mutase-like protein [Auriculariales sp. MPI-PUGE-AT-0066]